MKEANPNGDAFSPIISAVSKSIAGVTGEPAPDLLRVEHVLSPEEYIELARDARRWFEKAAAIEQCADHTWAEFVRCFSSSKHAHLVPGYLEMSHLLYGLALEAALKGEIVRLDPDSLKLKVTKDRTGSIESVAFEGIKGMGATAMTL